MNESGLEVSIVETIRLRLYLCFNKLSMCCSQEVFAFCIDKIYLSFWILLLKYYFLFWSVNINQSKINTVNPCIEISLWNSKFNYF